MMTGFHAKERTLTEWRALLAQSEWKPIKVNYGSRPMVITNNTIVAVPDTIPNARKLSRL